MKTGVQAPLGSDAVRKQFRGISHGGYFYKYAFIFAPVLLWFRWPKPSGQGDWRFRAIGDFLYLKTLYRLYKPCKKKTPPQNKTKQKKSQHYYLNRVQHSKFITPGALCHICSPFNHLNDFVNYGPLPATLVQARLTLASWREGWACSLLPSPWVPAGGPSASPQSHLHHTLKCWSELEPKLSRMITPRVFVYFLRGWLCCAALSHFQIVTCAYCFSV